MSVDYNRAFGLSDNPFGPLRPIGGLTNYTLGSQLEAKPLMLNAEPSLRRLFNEQMFPFGAHMQKFKGHVRRLGYSDSPPSAGNSSAVFSILGYQGTGKTTLAQAMISWLKSCRPAAGSWFMRDQWSVEKLKDCAVQQTRAAAEHKSLKDESTTNSYCCVVADNLLPGSLDRVLEMYDDLTRDRFVFLFLVSSEKMLFPRLSERGQREIIPFRLTALAAEPAVQFVRSRIGEFRVPQNARPPWMSDASLFPFDEQDINSAFAKGTIYARVDGDALALRDFSRMVNQMLADKLEEIDEKNQAFDIRSATEEDGKANTIRISAQYQDMVR